MSLTYSDYLKLDQLLDLQVPRSSDPEHDEHLFITVHQVYELWFKQLIHELKHLIQLLNQTDISTALLTIKRVLAIFKTLIQQVDVMETLTPTEFLSFRDRLESASGFQSYQFRQIEFIYGLKNPEHLNKLKPGSPEYIRLHSSLQQDSLWDGLINLLISRNCFSDNDKNNDMTIQASLIEIYHHNPELMQLCEAFVDLDAALQDWRYRHLKMVERTIGNKMGTGGSSGVNYLISTLFKPAFPDLWSIRSSL